MCKGLVLESAKTAHNSTKLASYTEQLRSIAYDGTRSLVRLRHLCFSGEKRKST